MKERNKNDDSTTVTIPIRELLKLPIETVPNECLDIEHTTLFRDAINEFIDSKVIMSRRELMNKNVIKIDKIDDLSIHQSLVFRKACIISRNQSNTIIG